MKLGERCGKGRFNDGKVITILRIVISRSEDFWRIWGESHCISRYSLQILSGRLRLLAEFEDRAYPGSQPWGSLNISPGRKP